MRVTKSVVVAIVAVVLFGVTGCGDDDILLSSLAITPDPGTAASPAGTQAFTATGTFTDGSTSTSVAGLAWSSGTPATATIDATTGVATCLAAGAVTITATAPIITGSSTTVSDTATLNCT